MTLLMIEGTIMTNLIIHIGFDHIGETEQVKLAK